MLLPAIALLGIDPKDSKGFTHPDVGSNIISNSKILDRSQCPLAVEWIKMWYTYTMEYYSAIKKNEILPFATTWMELEGIMLSEISRRKTEII